MPSTKANRPTDVQIAKYTKYLISDMVDALVIGMDALDSGLMKQYLMEGRLPNFKRLMGEGRLKMKAIDSYKSDDNALPHTPQAWSTIYTGGGAEHHGITTTSWHKAGVNFVEDVPATIFDDVSMAGLMSQSFRMAVTWPARDISGWMVSGFPSGTDEGIEESELWGVGEEMFPDSYAEIQDHWIAKHGTAKGMLDAEDKKLDIMKSLVDATGEPDVLFYGTQLPDKMAHEVTDYDEDQEQDVATKPMMKLAYEKMDTVLGRVIDEYDPALVIGISDHGFQRHFGGHSMRSTIFEYVREDVPEMEPGDTFDGIDSIVDFRDYFTDRLGIDQQRKGVQFQGDDGEVDQITEEEKEAAKEQLSDMGYL